MLKFSRKLQKCRRKRNKSKPPLSCYFLSYSTKYPSYQCSEELWTKSQWPLFHIDFTLEALESNLTPKVIWSQWLVTRAEMVSKSAEVCYDLCVLASSRAWSSSQF